VCQNVHLPELYEDARPEKYKTLQIGAGFMALTVNNVQDMLLLITN